MPAGTTLLYPDDTVVANWRAQCQFIHDSIIAAGWVQTADTGQYDIATGATPTTINQVLGYRMYRMADALQGASPVFIRVSFETFDGGASQHGLACYLTVGWATSGAGALAPSIGGGYLAFGQNIRSTGAQWPCRFSGDTNRILFSAFEGANGSIGSFFSLERTHNDDGSDNGDGVLVVMHNMSFNPIATGAWTCYTCLRADNSQAANGSGAGAANEKAPCIIGASLIMGADYNPVPLLHVTKRGYENPTKSCAGYLTTEIPDNNQQAVAVYGVNQNMRTPTSVHRNCMDASSYGQKANSAVMYRYD